MPAVLPAATSIRSVSSCRPILSRFLDACENPFFWKELRAHSRTAYLPLSRILFWQSLLFALLLLGLEAGWPAHHLPDPFRGMLPALLLGGAPVASCIAAGKALGSLVFEAEERQRTLEQLRIISLPVWRWLPQKLAYPLYCLALVWLAQIPAYAALVLRGHIVPRELAPIPMLAACAGLTAIGMALLTSDEQSAEQSQTRLRLDFRGLMYATVNAPIVELWMRWFFSRAVFSMRPVVAAPFYGGFLRTDAALVGLLVAFLVCAAVSAYGALLPGLARPALAVRLCRSLYWTLAYALLLGFCWRGFYRLGVLALLPLACVALWYYRRPLRRTVADAPVTSILAWLREHHENPVFIRDLRRHLRQAGWRRQLVRQVGGTLLLSAGLVALTYTRPLSLSAAELFGTWPPQWEWLARWAGVTAFYAPSLPFFQGATMGTRAQMLWHAEVRNDTVSQLGNTPLRSAQVTAGRWAAALVAGAPQLVAAGLFSLAGLSWMAATHGSVAGYYGAAQVALSAAGIVLAAQMGASGWVARGGLLPNLVSLGFVGNLLLVFFLVQAVMAGGASPAAGLCLWPAVGLVIALNGAAIASCFRGETAYFESVRYEQ